ncbi:MAG: M20/M25/M40 family metallo-hydrolase [Acidobacteriaceae bacterium]|jgi:hypothetical protein|nr:M20/M25/M40 family metallo-hydrolase [Acidobacteriaceae bacterium]
MRVVRIVFSTLLAVALLPLVVVMAQDTIDPAIVARIRAEATTHSKVSETFNYITNVTGARPTGSRAHKQAADYLRAKMAEWGLTNSHLEPFEFGRGWELEKFSLEMTGPRYFPLIGYPQAWTPSVKGVVTGTPIYLGDKTEEQITALGPKLRGAIVLASPLQTVFSKKDREQPADTDQPVRIGGPEPPRERQQPAAVATLDMNRLLQQFGAAAVLRPGNVEHGTAIVTGNIATRDDAIPNITLVAEHYNMLLHMIEAGVAPELRLELRVKYQQDDLNSYNVIADIPGEDPVLKNEIVLVGAHLDSWHAATGATDNADGAATAAEAMRILKAIGIHPRRTIRVALWSGEEVGFLGGKAYVAQHLTTQAARDAISVYLNNDPGTGATYGWYMANNAAARTIFDGWLAPLKDLGLKRNVMDSNFTSEDGVFDEAGIPAFTTIMDYGNYDLRTRHTNEDFFEAVSEHDLQQSAMVLAAFAYQAAMRDGKIPRRPAGVPASPRPPQTRAPQPQQPRAPQR